MVTEKSIQFYYANSFSLFALNRDLGQLNNITCCCASEAALYIGDAMGKVR